MAITTYQDTKDSGTAWLGTIPKTWDLRRIGNTFTQRNEKVSDKDFAPLSVTKKGVVLQLETAAKTNDGDNRKKVLAGDFVINSRSDRKGSSGLSELDGSVSLISTVIRSGELEPRYTHHLLRSYPFQEEYYRWGQGIVADLWSTNYQRMKNIAIPVPNDIEQKQIADFLDEETAKIDNLISKQQKLLKILEEKRRATITHAVTRGLDPNAELKETNIPWLKSIPIHWGTRKLKYFATTITDGTHVTPTYVADGIPFISIKDISSGKIDFSNCKYVSKEEHELLSKHTKIKKGDILFTRIGTLGVNVIIETDTIFDIFVSLGLLKIIPDSINREFLVYCMSSGYYFEYIQQVKAGGDTAAAKFNLSDVANSPIVVPPSNEQEQIADYLDKEQQKFDGLKQKIQSQIKLLRERRISLISHAVTGKIEV